MRVNDRLHRHFQVEHPIPFLYGGHAAQPLDHHQKPKSRRRRSDEGFSRRMKRSGREKRMATKNLAMNAVNLAIAATPNIDTGSHLVTSPSLLSGN